MVNELDLLIQGLRSEGDGEYDLDFAVDLNQARGHHLIPQASDYGLLELSKAVEREVSDLYLDGNDRLCWLTYKGRRVLLQGGAYSRLLQRARRAPLRLWVNGRRLLGADPQPLARLSLTRTQNIQGGFLDLPGPGQRGQVELVDRGVSFRLGPLFGRLRVVAHVTPQKGAPWPTRLVLTRSLRNLLGELFTNVQEICQSCRTRSHDRASSQSQRSGTRGPRSGPSRHSPPSSASRPSSYPG